MEQVLTKTTGTEFGRILCLFYRSLPKNNRWEHFATLLYIAYILIYLLNGWLKQQLIPIAIFTGAFIVGYAVIWLIVYSVTKSKTAALNQKLKGNLHTDCSKDL